MHHVAERGVGLGQQCLHILPHALCLAHYVAHVEHVALVVDAGCARDEDVGAVAILHAGASLEGHSILIGGVQVGGCIQVALLLGAESHQGISAHLYECTRVGRQSAYACAGYVVGVLCESLLGEVVLACLHHACILRVHVPHEEPCAHTVVGQCGTEVLQCLLIFNEHALGLPCAVALVLVHPHLPQMLVSVV